MFNRIQTLACLVALSSLSFGCSRPAQNPLHNGSIEFVADAPSSAVGGSAPHGSFVISGLDSAFSAHVSTFTKASSDAVRVELPAGVYGVDWNPDTNQSTEALTTATGLPRVIVVAPGRATTLRVHEVETASPDA